MTHRRAILAVSLLLMAACLLVLAGCGSSGCNGLAFTGSGGSSGSSGTFNSGGSVCGAGGNHSSGGGGASASDILYYLGSGTVIDAAGLTSSTFANMTGYTPVAFPTGTGFGENFWIVNKKFMYVPVTTPGNSAVGAVWGFAITRSSGALSVIGSSPYTTSTPNADIAISDPRGRFLFVADKGAGTIAVFTIDQNSGALTLSGSPIQTNSAPANMVVDGTGSYLYFAFGKQVWGFSINQNTGALTALLNSPFNEPVEQIQADPTGAWLIGVGGVGFSTDNNVYVIPIAPGTGNLGAAVAFATSFGPQFLALSPNGKFLFTFAADKTIQPLPIEGFTFNATSGSLTTMPNSPFSSLPGMVTGVFDQNSSTLVGVTGAAFTVFTVNGTTGVPTSPLPSLQVAHDERYALTN